MVFKFLTWLKKNTTEEEFEEVLEITTKDLVFNKLRFGKRFKSKYFIGICIRSWALLRGTEVWELFLTF